MMVQKRYSNIIFIKWNWIGLVELFILKSFRENVYECDKDENCHFVESELLQFTNNVISVENKSAI